MNHFDDELNAALSGDEPVSDNDEFGGLVFVGDTIPNDVLSQYDRRRKHAWDWYHSTTIDTFQYEDAEYTLLISYTYVPGEPQTYHHPGASPEVSIDHVWLLPLYEDDPKMDQSYPQIELPQEMQESIEDDLVDREHD